MTASVRIVNDGNCAGDRVTVRSGPDHSHVQELALGEVSTRLSADQTVKLDSVHEGPSVGDVRIRVVVPGHAECAGRAAYERYIEVLGPELISTPWGQVKGLNKAAWCAAAGVPDHLNPYLPGSC